MAAGVAVGTLLALGGGSGCSEPEPTPSQVVFCDAVCGRAESCDSNRVNRSCFHDCVTAEVRLAGVRGDAIAIVADCIGEIDCVTIFEGPYDACWQRAETETPRDVHTRDFCFAFSSALWECGWNYPVADCEASWGVWEDAVQDRVLACRGAASCAAFDACISVETGN